VRIEAVSITKKGTERERPSACSTASQALSDLLSRRAGGEQIEFVHVAMQNVRFDLFGFGRRAWRVSAICECHSEARALSRDVDQ